MCYQLGSVLIREWKLRFGTRLQFVYSFLLQLEFDVNAKDVDGWTPLHAAAHWGQKDACELLADHGANFSARNKMVSGPVTTEIMIEWHRG